MMHPAAALIPFLCLGSALAQEATSKPTSRPTSRPTASAPAAGKMATKQWAIGDERAIALAERVRDFAGGAKGWAAVDNVVFTFAGRRRLLWDVRAGKVRIESESKPGQRPGRGAWWGTLVYDVASGKAEQLAGPERPAADAKTEPATRAKGVWINDFYWLLVPLKVLDPGVRLSIDDAADDDREGVARLRLRFDAVGLTPSNEYVLHVEQKSGKVVQWDYYAKAGAEPRSWRFEGYDKVGPLHLSLSRPGVGGGGALELTDVAINVTLPADVWTRKKRVLDEL